ncbi:MAG: F0F1 ATP synthase subunit epsilon [Gemmatimonadetes bacterium]|nr:F0F1 ATP synthase subunit epsilon [Gemmatimonadota bacterium]
MADGTLQVRVVSPQKIVFEGDAAALVAPAWDGMVGILPGHAPFLTLVGVGELSIELPGGGSRSFQVAGGILKVLTNRVTVLTEYAGTEPPAEIPAEAIVHPEDVVASATDASS